MTILLYVIIGGALGWALGNTWQEFREDVERRDAKWALVSLLFNGAILFVLVRAWVQV